MNSLNQMNSISRETLKDSKLFSAKVKHKRFEPAENEFTYGMYYVVLPVKYLSDSKALPLNRKGFISFWEEDHGAKDGTALKDWIQMQFKSFGLEDKVKDVLLVAMPRVAGYSFNPVSFWLGLNNNSELIAVLAEVNNTFGETHSYMCTHSNGEVISANDWISSEKVFHVSPFFPRDGFYRFKFDVSDSNLSIWINYYDASGRCVLVTSLRGSMEPLTIPVLRSALFRHPLMTLKTVVLIHWQAMKLLYKRCRFFKKPDPIPERLTGSNVNRLYKEG